MYMLFYYPDSEYQLLWFWYPSYIMHILDAGCHILINRKRIKQIFIACLIYFILSKLKFYEIAAEVTYMISFCCRCCRHSSLLKKDWNIAFSINLQIHTPPSCLAIKHLTNNSFITKISVYWYLHFIQVITVIKSLLKMFNGIALFYLSTTRA